MKKAARKRAAAVVMALVMVLGITAGAASYTVASGDVLWKIAKEFGTDYKTLAQYNGIENPNLIYPGQVIKWNEGETPALEPKPVSNAVEYTATAQGFGGTVTVTIAVENGAMVSVKAWGPKETAGVGSRAIDALPSSILAAKSANVDGVAGATVTSGAVKLAAKKAMQEAFGTGEEAAAVMKPGSYKASAFGFYLMEPVPVTVTVSDKAILSIDVSKDCGETTTILQSVIDKLVPRMIAAQSVKVDSITGATASSAAVKTAVEDALKQALTAGGSDPSAIEKFYTVPAEKTDKKVLTTEVLVVGMGGSGTATAMSAAENGAKVLAIDKAGKYGGTSSISSEPFAVNPPKFQAEFNAGNDYIDKAVMRNAWLTYTTGADGQQNAKVELVDLMLDNSGAMIDWLMYEHGYSFALPAKGFTATDIYLCKYKYFSATADSNTRRSMTGTYFDSIYEDFKEAGGEYMLEVEATDLITDKATGAVKGVIAKGDDGTSYEIYADAVVLATGGFAGNGEMEKQYLSNEFYPLSGEWKHFGMHQNDGKMIAAAIENGAATYNIGIPPMVHNTATPVLLTEFPVSLLEGPINSRTGRGPTQSINDIPIIMAVSANILAVGNSGKRFTSESDLVMLNSWMNGPKYYSIWSDEQIKNIQVNGFKVATTNGYVGQGGVSPNVPMTRIYEVLDAAMEAGYVYKADTIEALAAKIGVSAENLTKTVADYNGYCETGVDTEYGKAADMLVAIGEGPYYAVVGSPWCYSTCGGLDVDTQLRVLDKSGKPIPGLYAVGTDSIGVLFSEEKPYVTYGGAAQGWAYTSGMVCGKAVAAYVAGK